MPPPVMIATGNNKRAEPETIAKGLERAMRCVCAVSAPGSQAGTGTLIGPDLVLTNYHVVEQLMAKGADFEGAECRFDYRLGEDGGPLDVGNTQTIFNIREIVVASEPSPGDVRDGGDAFDDDKLDFAIIRLDAQAGRFPDYNGTTRGWIPLARSGERPDPDIGQEFMILQYPYEIGGAFILQPLKSDTAEFTDVRGAAGQPARYIHNGITRRGSSGGPCFATTFQFAFIALHNASLGETTDEQSRGQAIPLRRISGFIERRYERPASILGLAPPQNPGKDVLARQRAESIERRKEAALCLMDRSREERRFLARLFAASTPQAARPLLHVVICRTDDAHSHFVKRLKFLSFESPPDRIGQLRLMALTKGLSAPSRTPQPAVWPQQDDVAQRRQELSDIVQLLDPRGRYLLLLSRTIDAAWSLATEEPLLTEFAAMLANHFGDNRDGIQAVVCFIVADGEDSDALLRQFAGLWSAGAPPHCGVCVRLSQVGFNELDEWRAVLETAWAANDTFNAAIASQFNGTQLKPLDIVAKGLDVSLCNYIAGTLDRSGKTGEPRP
ncbi:trypsin-like peptidase domain-containing protein [Bradyrhizobium sp. 4]|uniref:trypsin-like serine peptidase n=1 Tax=unclassified Bradyrhizobium TaxID=2631580 RepID=UPI001FF77127|nr:MULTISPECIES: serine protease [unclassified Bradyrhizobium]MCK1400024.1 trypsin-like peptidase domain-containing protein [Bradyrhizobium sp. 39]MCK1750314.1 trypsin-like peptidase domain-containing protein [Bradyrhizobium sp. 135]UPJ31929.1 trypsin-like peptidase domain-containing protein [Bradyrhizobium sp. 4]